MVEKQSETFHTFLWHFFSSLKYNFIAYRSSKVSSRPNCIFLTIHLLWQSGFCRVYSNSCCSCSFEVEIIQIGQSSHKMYSNNIVNFQESTTILNAHTKKVWKLIVCTSYLTELSWGAYRTRCFSVVVIRKRKAGDIINQIINCIQNVSVRLCYYVRFIYPHRHTLFFKSDNLNSLRLVSPEAKWLPTDFSLLLETPYR